MVGTCGLGAVGPTRSRLEARSAHESGDAIFGGAIALSPQLGGHPGAAVRAGVTVLMDRSHCFQEEGVFGRASALGALLPRMIAAGANSQSIAKFGDFIVLPHGVNQRILLCGSSESMLMAFLRFHAGDGGSPPPHRQRGLRSRCREPCSARFVVSLLILPALRPPA